MTEALVPRQRPTMRDVAALSGVSIKTVSRVVNNEAGVSPDLIERVNDAARKLDYQRDLTASSLRRSDGKSQTLGLLLENVANPFSSALHRVIEDSARDHGVTVFAGSVDEDPGARARPRRGLQRATRRRAHRRARPATTSPTSPARCATGRRSCSSTVRRRCCRPTRSSPTTSAAPATRWPTSCARATTASPTSVTCAASSPPPSATPVTALPSTTRTSDATRRWSCRTCARATRPRPRSTS